MPHWGYLLLFVYVALGLSKISRRKAGSLITVITVGVIAAALHSYGAI